VACRPPPELLDLTRTPCAPPPVVVATLPAILPGEADIDPSTSLHTTGDVQVIDPEAYRLEVVGKVRRPLSLTYDDLRCLPHQEIHCTLVCPGFFEDEATWGGAPLRIVLDMAGVRGDATELRLYSQDRYHATVPLTAVLLSAASQSDALLAYELEGQTLPPLHGFPLRAVFPDLDGNVWVKWLVKIDVR
jgi:DMSO/TMAO reductase YedYZ molybdopterin-dependent catalytic subunit